MYNYLAKASVIVAFLFSSYSHACGDNANAIIQGPFEDRAFNDGYICFQRSPDGRDILFYLSHSVGNSEGNFLIDTFHYSDAPVELMSVFFTPVSGERNVTVLLRWKIEYENDGVQYPYYYEVRAYRSSSEVGYRLNLDSKKDPNLSGYQKIQGKNIVNYPLNNSGRIREYLLTKYGAVAK